ncbi:MAG: hypothetical protein RLZZ606_743, partial [Actinomycetota bacterium]
LHVREDFERLEKEWATTFGKMAKKNNVKRMVYLPCLEEAVSLWLFHCSLSYLFRLDLKRLFYLIACNRAKPWGIGYKERLVAKGRGDCFNGDNLALLLTLVSGDVEHIHLAWLHG